MLIFSNCRAATALVAMVCFASVTERATAATTVYGYVVNTGELIQSTGGGPWTHFGTGGGGYLAVDGGGHLYEGTYNVNTSTGSILKYDSSGTPTVFASTGASNPQGLAFDHSGNLFVGNFSTTGPNTIEKITPDSTTSVFATGLSGPSGLAVDSSGNLFVADGGTIFKYDQIGTKSVFASYSGSALQIAFDSQDNLYLANQTNFRVDKFTPQGVSSIFDVRNGASNFGIPEGIAFDAASNELFISWAHQNVIVAYPLSGGLSFTSDSNVSVSSLAASPVPEPACLVSLGLGATVMMVRRRKR